MYNIGEFSKISDTSVQTLRYYDSLDLLKQKQLVNIIIIGIILKQN